MANQRNKIIGIILAVGLDPDKDFYIGTGADKFSEIQCHPYTFPDLQIQLQRKEYFVQFCDNLVAIWEVGKRFDLGGSINMHWTGLTWEMVKESMIKDIRIKGEDAKTEVAVMPIDFLHSYLKLKLNEKNKENEETIYINRKEGKKIETFSTRYERDPKLRQKAIDFHGTTCQACGFSFADKYGKYGEGYIEVHHKKPLSEGEREPNPESDMVCLCSNCHRMIHRKKYKVLTVEELKSLMKDIDNVI